MMTIQERLATQNPANAPEKIKVERSRIPMSLPVQRLSAPEIPGLHLHWMAGNAARIEQALAGGYRFINRSEIELNRVGIADGPLEDGSSDLGSRVKIADGTDGLYLMGIPVELWLKDQDVLAERNEQIASVLRGDKGIPEVGGDNSNRYVPRDAGNKQLFHPKPRRG